MNHWVLNTNGCWEDTILTNNGEEVPATKFFLEIECGRDFSGDPVYGGVAQDGQMTGLVRLQDGAFPEIPLFPGVVEIILPGNHLVVENLSHTELCVPTTVVQHDGVQVECSLLLLSINLDYDSDTMWATIETLRDNFQSHLDSPYEIITTEML